MNEPEAIEIYCSACQHGDLLGTAEMARWLLKRGLLQRSSEAEPALLKELVRVHAGRQACSQCQHVGLVVKAPEEAGFNWPQARSCEYCRQLLDVERLEIFPDATLCASCQRQREQRIEPRDLEYCPRCGAVMQVRQSKRSGVTRFELRCTSGCRS